MSVYQEVILDHYKHPRASGLEAEYDSEGYAVNPICGDEAMVRFTAGRMSHSVVGCSISQAAASVLAEEINEGSNPEAVLDQFSAVVTGQADGELPGDFEAFAGVVKHPARVKCALLPVAAARSALDIAHEGGSGWNAQSAGR